MPGPHDPASAPSAPPAPSAGTGAGHPAPPRHPDERAIVERRLAGHDASHGHDTAGLPWQGRDLHDSPFRGDTGAADPLLLDALVHRADDTELTDALAASRLLVPVVAMPTHVEAAEATGLTADANSDMATVVLTAPDGERALPVFTSVDAIAAWDPAARPVPVSPVDAAQAAVEERCSVMVVDVASPHRRVVRSSQVWALAQGRRWLHAADDPIVRAALGDVVARTPGLSGADAAPGDHGSLLVTLVLDPGLPADAVNAVSGAVAQALAVDDVRVRLDDVRLALRAAR